MKAALICFGNEESYGLSFVAGELLSLGIDVRFFEGDCVSQVVSYNPDYVMFSPLTTFFNSALEVCQSIKSQIAVISVFGGHHAMAVSNLCDSYDCIDVTVIGPVRGSIERILSGERGCIVTQLTDVSDLAFPARDVYYKDIPRIGSRYRKFMLSVFGCPWSCSYCSSSSSRLQSMFGPKEHKRYYLKHRPLDVVIKEAELVKSYGTEEIEWVDDDIFMGDPNWLMDFIRAWDCIGLPIYVSASSKSILRASDDVLLAFRKYVNVVGVGVQAARKSSLSIFNRSWDSIEQVKEAYERLTSFGYKVNLQYIVGLPVSDPVDDAVETTVALSSFAKGSICSCYPLMIYPGTVMKDYCQNNGFELNITCNGDTNSAVCGIKFDSITMERLKNLCKIATMAVKYGIDENWLRVLLDIDYNDDVSRRLSTVRYYDCVTDRLGMRGHELFNSIMSCTKIRY